MIATMLAPLFLSPRRLESFDFRFWLLLAAPIVALAASFASGAPSAAFEIAAAGM